MRAAATRILTSTRRLLEDPDTTASDFLAAIDALEEKDAILNELSTKISDHLDGQEYEDEIAGTLKHHDEIRHAITKLRYILNERYHLLTGKTTVRAVTLPSYLIEALKGDRTLSSTEDLGKTQTDSVELNVTQGPEQTRNELPPREGEYIFVPDFVKNESFPQLPGNLPAPIYEVVHEISPMREAESFHLPDVGKI